MSGRLFGVGVGPGDPELLTLKAKRILEDVDYICTPKAEKGSKSRAFEVVDDALDTPARAKELLFPMVEDVETLKRAWKEASDEIVRLLGKENDLAFITLGDPLLYSTYNYVLDNLTREEEISVETVPGINSIGASAARLNLPLAKGNEKLTILPVPSEPEELERILTVHENVAFLKVSRNYNLLVDKLEENGLKDSSYLVSRCGQNSDEVVTKELDRYLDKGVPYLSVVISKSGAADP